MTGRQGSNFSRGWVGASKGVFVQFHLIRVLANANDAILLSQILFWQDKLKVCKDGHYWLAKTYKDWEDETGINEHTARKSISRMRDLGLIETKVMKFDGMATVHVRILWDRFEEMLNPLKDIGSDKNGQTAPSEKDRAVCPNRSDLKQRVLTESTNREDPPLPPKEKKEEGDPKPEKEIQTPLPLKADQDPELNSERPAPSFRRPPMERDTGDPFFGKPLTPWLVRGAADGKETPHAEFMEYLQRELKWHRSNARALLTQARWNAEKQATAMIYWEDYQELISPKPSPTQGSRPHQIEQADGSRIVQSSTPGKAYRITRDEDGNEKAEMINIPEEHQ